MKSYNGIEIRIGDSVTVSGSARKRFKLFSSLRGRVTAIHSGVEKLVSVLLQGEDQPTDFHPRSLRVE